MKNLARYDHQLAGKLRPDRIRFTDLLALEDATLFPVLRAADPELIVLALAGASAQWIERVARALPLDQARALERGLPHLGPVRLSDVEEAQQALADFAVEMEERGEVMLGAQPRNAKPQANDPAFRL
jgi:flagellar motor switch protein FliG